jgi:hypothetical protein
MCSVFKDKHSSDVFIYINILIDVHSSQLIYKNRTSGVSIHLLFAYERITQDYRVSRTVGSTEITQCNNISFSCELYPIDIFQPSGLA